MKYSLFLVLMGCASMEPVGKTIQDLAPAAKVIPGGAGEAIYYVLYGVGGLIALIGARYGVKKVMAKSE